ncbi:MAG: DEAD/DEAH box helicase [Caldilineaceae bacterium]|nr:DEAD/DEAH box helicase [Caldilineaceae bacterium]
MSLPSLVQRLRRDPQFMATVASWRTLPGQPGAFEPVPPALNERLRAALRARGIDALYVHQAAAVEHTLAGHNVAVVTPTASGKTLCYNLPVLHTLLADPTARALYLFPTKALAQDQLAELGAFTADIAAAGAQSPLTVATYDGDTPAAVRSSVRKASRLVLTNPDMLHVGILPYHTQWAAFFEGLRWVVVDEMHVYRGVFGSHVANVLRRLQRICAHYGSHVRFICTSATIANPGELAERLVEQPVTLIDQNGAPRGEKHVLLVNPPLIDAERGLRRAASLESADLAARCLDAGLQTIVFGRSRLVTELLLTYLRSKAEGGEEPGNDYSQHDERAASDARGRRRARGETAPRVIRGYRGGYLPGERREIEAGLRSGAVRGVVATNALELGIDIGGLEAAVLCGYPGSIASTWQQMGRAGRTADAAMAMMVATAGPLDQYVIQHPEFIFERSPEHALINPDNLMLLTDHLRCAAFELPFRHGERFGLSPFTADVLQLLVEAAQLHLHGDLLFWSGASYPARQVSLRSAGSDAVVIQRVDETAASSPTVIGEVDETSAHFLVHDGAIYMHEAESYIVQRLDLSALRADVTAADVDYYTEAISDAQVTVLEQHAARRLAHTAAAFGDVAVESQVVGYRRVKRVTHETLGVYPLTYPPRTLETSAYWLEILPETQMALERAGLWYDSINDYGPNWAEQRARVRARDRYRCVVCGAEEPAGREHDVHHKIPFRAFGYVPGLNEHYLVANSLDNLILVCRTCHRRLETAGRLQSGLDGLAYVLGNLAPLYLMCDRADLGAYVERGNAIGSKGIASNGEEAAGETALETTDVDFYGEATESAPSQGSKLPVAPRIYLYERIPAGLGFSSLLYEMHETLLEAAYSLVTGCPCERGCPACVGPVLEEEPMQLETKRLTLGLLELVVTDNT